MKRRQRLTEHQVTRLPIRPKRYFQVDPEMAGHYIRIMPSGVKSFTATARTPHGKQIWFTVGTVGVQSIAEAREAAREAIKRIKKGLPPTEPVPTQPDSFADVSANWIKRYVEKERLISQPEIQRVLNKYILPSLGEQPFTSIRRSEVSNLLDKIEDKHGPRQADLALSIMRGIANWYSTRDDIYLSPFATVRAKGMRRSRSRPRDRILDDEEIRTVWKQAGLFGTYGAFVKVLLLTAQRREAVRTMRWSDLALSDDGGLIWTIPKEDREKGNAGKVKLTALAVQIINALPRIEGNAFVFASDRTDRAIIGNGSTQMAFLKACALPRWTVHDLRRTGRSLLARAGISREIGERIMGHVLPGVEGTYNRFDYFEQKSHALAALANLIDDILHPTLDKVIPIRKGQAHV
jgi:integrase